MSDGETAVAEQVRTVARELGEEVYGAVCEESDTLYESVYREEGLVVAGPPSMVPHRFALNRDQSTVSVGDGAAVVYEGELVYEDWRPTGRGELTEIASGDGEWRNRLDELYEEALGERG